jgi:hypothetical protein
MVQGRRREEGARLEAGVPIVDAETELRERLHRGGGQGDQDLRRAGGEDEREGGERQVRRTPGTALDSPSFALGLTRLFQSDMNLNNAKKMPLTMMSLDQKKQMLILKCKGTNQDVGHKFDKPTDYTTYLEQYSRPELLNMGKILNCVESLRIALTNNILSWMREFGYNGMKIVFKVLDLAIKE